MGLLWEESFLGSPPSYSVRLFGCSLLGEGAPTSARNPHLCPVRKPNKVVGSPRGNLGRIVPCLVAGTFYLGKGYTLLTSFPSSGILAARNISDSNRNIIIHNEVKNKKVNSK